MEMGTSGRQRSADGGGQWFPTLAALRSHLGSITKTWVPGLHPQRYASLGLRQAGPRGFRGVAGSGPLTWEDPSTRCRKAGGSRGELLGAGSAASWQVERSGGRQWDPAIGRAFGSRGSLLLERTGKWKKDPSPGGIKSTRQALSLKVAGHFLAKERDGAPIQPRGGRLRPRRPRAG